MKRIALFLALVVATAARGQVVTITERDPDGGEHGLDLAVGGTIVDINSELAFTLDRDRLATEIGGLPDLASPRLSAQIQTVTALQEIVARGMTVLPRLAQALVSQRMGADVTDSVRAVNRDLAPLLRSISDAFPPEQNGARERINEAIMAAAQQGGGMITRYEAVLGQAAQEVTRLRQGLNELAREEGVTVQFGGWITTREGTTAIHLDKFDNHPDAEPFDVERWDFSLSDDQKAELAGYQDFAREYRAGERSLGELVWAQARRSLAAEALVASCLSRIEAAVDGLQVTADVQAVKRAAAELGARLDNLQGLATSENAEPDGLKVLMTFNDASRTVAAGARQLLTEVETTADALPADAAADKQKLLNVLASCRADLKALLADESLGAGRLFALVKSSREVSLAALAFGEEVLRHELGRLPIETNLALRNTGVRADGDVLSFKLAVGRAQQPAATVQDFRLQMYRVEPFVTTAPVLIFAQPDHTGAFQPAPAYSLILAKGHRHSRLYNQLWRPGLGLNLSLLDFDHDDKMELGFAGVATLLRDMVQVGYGINLAQNRGYWFLGLRLPMPGGSL